MRARETSCRRVHNLRPRSHGLGVFNILYGGAGGGGYSASDEYIRVSVASWSVEVIRMRFFGFPPRHHASVAPGGSCSSGDRSAAITPVTRIPVPAAPGAPSTNSSAIPAAKVQTTTSADPLRRSCDVAPRFPATPRLPRPGYFEFSLSGSHIRTARQPPQPFPPCAQRLRPRRLAPSASPSPV